MDLAKVKANFLHLERSGWFLPGASLYEVKFPHNGISPKGYGEAAVLFLINKQLQVLLTKRSSHVSNFKGEACFPGGSHDKSDVSFVQTALREAQEEVNLNHSHIEVVFTLPPAYTHLHTLTIINPIVALTSTDINELDLVPEPTEVECLYWIPLEFFLTNGKNMIRNGIPQVVFDYLDPKTGMNHAIFGITAHLCGTLSSMALGKLPDNSMYKPSLIRQVKEENETDSTVVVLSPVMVTGLGVSKL